MLTNQSNRVIIRVWTSKKNKEYPGEGVGHISIETPNKYISLWPVPFTEDQINEHHEQLRQIEELGQAQKQDGIQIKLLIQKKQLELKKLYQRYFMERKADFHQTFQDDYVAEEMKNPQVVICLYSLDVKAMDDMFQRLVNTVDSWRLIGSNLFVQTFESALNSFTFNLGIFESSIGKRSVESCSSLALKILKAGDITNLISLSEKSSFGSKTSSAVSPDQILDILIPAKKNELQKYPHTQHFQYSAETIITAQNNQKSKTLDDGESNCLVM